MPSHPVTRALSFAAALALACLLLAPAAGAAPSIAGTRAEIAASASSNVESRSMAAPS